MKSQRGRLGNCCEVGIPTAPATQSAMRCRWARRFERSWSGEDGERTPDRFQKSYSPLFLGGNGRNQHGKP